MEEIAVWPDVAKIDACTNTTTNKHEEHSC